MKKAFSLLSIKLLPALTVLFAVAPLSAQSPKAKVEGRPSVALVLAGGGSKGYAHLPVLELIEELGIPVDMIIGTSAGSIIGGLYAAGYTPELMKEHLFSQDWVGIFNDQPRYSFENELGSLGLHANPVGIKFKQNFAPDLGKGFSAGEHAYRLFKTLTVKIPSYIDFDDLAIPFRAVSAELLSGDMEVLGTGDVAEAIRASISIPGVFEPFLIDGKRYVDGMMRNNLPISVAKDMGFDVIIAVEISDTLYTDEDAYDSAPLVALFQLYSVYVKTVNDPQYLLADTVIHPDVQRFNPLDFTKAKEIYEASAKDKEKYRAMLLQVREKIFPGGASPLPPLDPQRIASYEERSAIVPERAEIYGELDVDTAYIRNRLDRMILGKPLTEESAGAFIDEIYRTGNYLFVTCRMNMRGGTARFEVRLSPVPQKSTYVLLGGSYRGTFSNDAISKLDLTTTLQWRGSTGPGSALSFSATVMSDFGARFQFMQPLSQKTFVQVGAEIAQDQDFITLGYAGREITGSRILRGEGGMNVGIKFDRNHLFTFGPRLVWMDTSRVEGIPEIPAETADDGIASPAHFGIPISLDYAFSTLDFSCLPTRGFFVNVNNQAILTLKGDSSALDGNGNPLPMPPVYDIIAVDFTAIIPLNAQLGVGVSLFAGSDVTMNLAKVPSQMPVFGFNNFDRMFFPQIAGKQHYGAHKAAAALTLQFHPWKNVTILGGQLFFSVNAGIGQVVPNFADFSGDTFLWNVNAATGFRLNSAFGVQLRFGAGSKEFTNELKPFISLDIGHFRL